MKNYYLPIFRLALIVLLSLFFSNCEKDEIIPLVPEAEVIQTVLDFEAKNVDGTTLFKENKELGRHISTSFLSNDVREDQLNSSLYDFSIDTDNVQVISGDTFDSYTFIVKRETSTPNILENYILTVFNDSGYTQMLVTYPYVLENGEIEYIFSQATAQYIVNPNLLLGESSSPCPSTSEEIIAWEDGGCIPVNCGDVGNHSPGQACDNGEYVAHWQCSGAWAVTGCVYTSGGFNTGATDPSNATTNGGSSTGTNSHPTQNYPSNIPIVPKTENLLHIDGIDFGMTEWLNTNVEIKLELQNFYNTNNNPITRAIILELIELMQEELTANLNVLKFIIKAIQDDKYDNDIDVDFINSVHPQLDMFSQNDNPAVDLQDLHEELVMHFVTKCAVLRFNHPDWSNLRIFYVASKDIVHMQLDVLGLIPVVGEIADLTNGVLYTIEGDGVNASLSYASAIPFVGWVSTGTKYAIKVVYTTATKVKLVWKLGADGLIQFGRRSQLRKVLNLPVGDPRQAHHIIPWAEGSHEAVQLAAKSSNAFHMNEALNGIAVAAWRNQPNHNLYNQRVAEKLDNIFSSSSNVDEAYELLNNFIESLRTAIVNNPNTHLNDLVF